MKRIGDVTAVLGALACLGGWFAATRYGGIDGANLVYAIWSGVLFVTGALLLVVGMTLSVVGREPSRSGEAEESRPMGQSCSWCRQIIPAGQRPCSYDSDDGLRGRAPGIANETCQRILAERGLLRAT